MVASRDHLVPKQVVVQRNGQQVLTTVYVNPEDAASTTFRVANGGAPAPAITSADETTVGEAAMINPDGLAVITDTSDPAHPRLVTSNHLRADGDHAVEGAEWEPDGVIYCGECGLNVTSDDRHGADLDPEVPVQLPERQSGYVLYDREADSEVPAVTYRAWREGDLAGQDWGEQTFVIEDRVNGNPDLGYVVQTANGVERAAELAHERQMAGVREDDRLKREEDERRDREDATARFSAETFRRLVRMTSADIAYHRQATEDGPEEEADARAARSWLSEAEGAAVDLGRQYKTPGWTEEAERARYVDRTFKSLPPSVLQQHFIQDLDPDSLQPAMRDLRAEDQRRVIRGYAETVFRVAE